RAPQLDWALKVLAEYVTAECDVPNILRRI
ncbi:hypothetical protein LCGC14_3166220, partial [marine sediment metagenome]